MGQCWTIHSKLMTTSAGGKQLSGGKPKVKKIDKKIKELKELE